MAPVPHSFIQNFVNNRKGAQPSNSGTPPSAPPKPKNKPAPRHVRRRPGFFRRTLGAVAGEVLKGTGHIGKHVVNAIHGVHEDAMGSGGVPTNNASSGAVNGLGVGPQEPGVKRGKKAPRLSYKMFNRAKGARLP